MNELPTREDFKECRLHHGLNQTQMGAEMGVSLDVYHRLESGKVPINKFKALAFIQALTILRTRGQWSRYCPECNYDSFSPIFPGCRSKICYRVVQGGCKALDCL